MEVRSPDQVLGFGVEPLFHVGWCTGLRALCSQTPISLTRQARYSLPYSVYWRLGTEDTGVTGTTCTPLS